MNNFYTVNLKSWFFILFLLTLLVRLRFFLLLVQKGLSSVLDLELSFRFVLQRLQLGCNDSQKTIGRQLGCQMFDVNVFRQLILADELAGHPAVIVLCVLVFGRDDEVIVHDLHLDLFRLEMLHVQHHLEVIFAGGRCAWTLIMPGGQIQHVLELVVISPRHQVVVDSLSWRRQSLQSTYQAVVRVQEEAALLGVLQVAEYEWLQGHFAGFLSLTVICDTLQVDYDSIVVDFEYRIKVTDGCNFLATLL